MSTPFDGTLEARLILGFVVFIMQKNLIHLLCLSQIRKQQTPSPLNIYI
jgi:hypothetical protein